MPPFERDTDESRGRRGLLVPIGVLCISVVVLALPPAAEERVSSALRGSVLAPFLWMQSSLHDASVLSENLAELQARLDSAVAELHSRTTLAEENRRLRALLDLRTRGGARFVPASALRSGTLGSESMFTLDVGREDGLSVNDPVVDADGLVGMVRQVYARASVAMDWTNPDFRASAMTVDGEVFGIVEPRQGSFREADRLVLNGVPYNASVEDGVLVVTSGRGSVYPRGIPIGIVSGLAEAGAGWLRSYWVVPAVRPGRANHVLVYTGAEDMPPEALWGSRTEPAGPGQ